MESTITPLKLFQAHGIELEYMIVHKDSLDVFPMTDRLIHDVLGFYSSDVEKEKITWSNEVALHVVELKTTHPEPSLINLETFFQKEVCIINGILDKFGGILLPSAMHPWMDPVKEMKLWPHESNAIYEAFNRIFNCSGHGWANLQSAHINLPFANEKEFEKLHAAIRLVLPIIPALAASSPIMDGKVTGMRDTRLDVYRKNSAKIPSITGQIIPESIRTYREYEVQIFERIYRDIGPHDPEKTLQHEWLNARGAITRFMRNTIEIRLIDVQEAPIADLAIAYAVTSLIKGLVEERWTPLAQQHSYHENELKQVLMNCIRHGEEAMIEDTRYLEVFGWKKGFCSAKDLWNFIISRCVDTRKAPQYHQALQHILDHGTLSTRILKSLKTNSIKNTYQQLSQHLAKGCMFIPS